METMMTTKIVVAVDMDEVLVDLLPSLNEYYNLMFAKSLTVDDYHSLHFTQIWKELDATGVHTFIESFCNIDNKLMELKPIVGSQEILSKLKETNRFSFYIITGRSDTYESVTRKWMDLHFKDVFEDVKFCNTFSRVESRKEKIITKYDACMKIGAKVLIDDNWDVILSSAQQSDYESVDIKFLLYESPWNREQFSMHSHRDNIGLVRNWKDIHDFLQMIHIMEKSINKSSTF